MNTMRRPTNRIILPLSLFLCLAYAAPAAAQQYLWASSSMWSFQPPSTSEPGVPGFQGAEFLGTAPAVPPSLKTTDLASSVDPAATPSPSDRPLAEALPLVPPVTDADFKAMAAELDARNRPTWPWYPPLTWFPWDGWTNSAELGINGSSGNAESLSFQTGARFKRQTDVHLFDFRTTYNRTQSGGIETQNNSLTYADFDRFFGQSPWSAFLKQGLEYDQFKEFDARYNINSGLAYRFVKTDRLSLQGRFGAGASREFGGPDRRWVPEALFGTSYEHQLNKRNKWIAKVDYFPEWGDFNNYRIVSDASWEILWDEVGNLSLKLGAIDRYDSTPNGRKPNDLTYSLLLLYKF
jgi:putative salt-induced outer membrane protein YdiY